MNMLANMQSVNTIIRDDAASTDSKLPQVHIMLD